MPFAQASPELGAGQIEHGLAWLDLVLGHVLAAVLDVGHLLERHHLDAELRLHLLQQRLGVIRPVERLACPVAAGPGVVAPDDEMGAAEVLADDRVPDRLARPGHAHGERQEAQQRGLLGIGLEHLLVAADAREMVDVARLGLPDHWVDQEVRLGDLGGALGQLLMRPVHRIARLEGDHPLPAPAGEFGAQVLGVVAQLGKIVLHRRGDAGERTAEVDGVGPVEQIVDARMRLVGRAEDGRGLASPVRLEDRLHGHGRDQEALRIAQPDALAGAQAIDELARHVKRDRHRPKSAVGQAHALEHRLIVGRAEEAGQRREAAVQQQLQVAQLPLGQIPGGVLRRLRPEGGGLIGRQIEEAERPAMRLNQCHAVSSSSLLAPDSRRWRGASRGGPTAEEGAGQSTECWGCRPADLSASPRC